eukprot:gb/GECG01002638.1/.p1 GENE.gb/GECG01002638.1/~~gb/GECG01002638.1/.p1  ORF type:complete len:113 (+),score=6.49 gb/GECG01002638.1/:1-339(+)
MSNNSTALSMFSSSICFLMILSYICKARKENVLFVNSSNCDPMPELYPANIYISIILRQYRQDSLPEEGLSTCINNNSSRSWYWGEQPIKFSDETRTFSRICRQSRVDNFGP